VFYGYEPPLIETTRPTLASVLRSGGYRTGCVGKWHLGLGYSSREGESIDPTRPFPWPEADRNFEEKIDFNAPIDGGPLSLGFDSFFGTSGCSTCQPPYGFIEGNRFTEPPSVYLENFPYTGRPGMASPSWDHAGADLAFTRKAVDFILAGKEAPQPFFLYFAPSAAHEPCVESVVPAFARGKSEAGPRGDLVWLFDWMVGQVVDALKRSGRLEDTVILVTSDNGALPGDRVATAGGGERYKLWNHRSCGDLRGYKSHIWEGGHRIPLVVSWPGRVEPGSRCSEPVALHDLLATAASMASVPVPAGAAEDSLDLSPLLSGEPPRSQTSTRNLVHHSGTGVFSLRSGEWKLVCETQGSGGWPPPAGSGPVPGSPGQLYRLDKDPGEVQNLFDREPRIVRELSETLEVIRLASPGS
jgi:arylsulfatase A-like enzyme